jgi:hypothetical protein
MFDVKLGEFNMESIILQIIDPNCKKVHALSRTFPRSGTSIATNQGNCKIGDIRILEEDFFSE